VVQSPAHSGLPLDEEDPEDVMLLDMTPVDIEPDVDASDPLVEPEDPLLASGALPLLATLAAAPPVPPYSTSSTPETSWHAAAAATTTSPPQASERIRRPPR
jgi:hypothetical protein